MIKKLLLTKLFLLGIIFAFAFSCGPRHKSIDERANWIVKKLNSELDLTDDQKKNLEKIKTEVVQKMKEKKGDRKKVYEESLKQLKEGKFEADKINKMIDDQMPGREEIRRFMVVKVGEFYTTLTKEQKEKAYKARRENAF